MVVAFRSWKAPVMSHSIWANSFFSICRFKVFPFCTLHDLSAFIWSLTLNLFHLWHFIERCHAEARPNTALCRRARYHGKSSVCPSVCDVEVLWPYSLGYANLCPIHTADADATKLFCRVGVGGVNNSQLVVHDDCRRIRSTIWKLTKQTP